MAAFEQTSLNNDDINHIWNYFEVVKDPELLVKDRKYLIYQCRRYKITDEDIIIGVDPDSYNIAKYTNKDDSELHFDNLFSMSYEDARKKWHKWWNTTSIIKSKKNTKKHYLELSLKLRNVLFIFKYAKEKRPEYSETSFINIICDMGKYEQEIDENMSDAEINDKMNTILNELIKEDEETEEDSLKEAAVPSHEEPEPEIETSNIAEKQSQHESDEEPDPIIWMNSDDEEEKKSQDDSDDEEGAIINQGVIAYYHPNKGIIFREEDEEDATKDGKKKRKQTKKTRKSKKRKYGGKRITKKKSGKRKSMKKK